VVRPSAVNWVVNHLEYDAFGQIVSQTGGEPRFTYTARERDVATGLYYYRARWYDAGTGRFLSEDPLSYAAGDINVYRYVGNSPTNLADPSGLFWTPLTGGLIGGLIGGIAGGIGYVGMNLIRGGDITAGGLAGAMLGGATAGAIIGACPWAAGSVLGAAGAGAAGGAVDSVVRQGIDTGHIRPEEVIQDAAVGAAAGAGGHLAVKGGSAALRALRGGKVSPRPSSLGAKLARSESGGALIPQAAESVPKAPSNVTEGIYEFTASSGKTYVGQSGNIPGRIGQHLGSGKLLESELSTVRTTEVLGGKTAREIAEQLRINQLGGVRNLENIRNPIGPNRQYLLPPTPGNP